MNSAKSDLSLRGLMPLCQEPMRPRSDDTWFIMNEAKKTKFPFLGADPQNNSDVLLKPEDVHFAAKHVYYYGKMGYRSPSSSFSMSDACLLLILEYTPLSGGGGLRLFSFSDTKPWIDFLEDNNVSAKSLSSVFKSVKEKDASKEIESKLSESQRESGRISPSLFGTIPGHLQISGGSRAEDKRNKRDALDVLRRDPWVSRHTKSRICKPHGQIRIL